MSANITLPMVTLAVKIQEVVLLILKTDSAIHLVYRPMKGLTQALNRAGIIDYTVLSIVLGVAAVEDPLRCSHYIKSQWTLVGSFSFNYYNIITTTYNIFTAKFIAKDI